MGTGRLRGVIDTNVVFEGLTRRGSAPGVIVDAWLAGVFDACISNALGYEYHQTLSRKLAPHRWLKIRPTLKMLLARAEPIDIRYTWRPSSPDPGDEHIIDCAMNAGAVVVTFNLRDFEMARAALGLPVLTPVEFLIYLDESTSETDPAPTESEKNP